MEREKGGSTDVHRIKGESLNDARFKYDSKSSIYKNVRLPIYLTDRSHKKVEVLIYVGYPLYFLSLIILGSHGPLQGPEILDFFNVKRLLMILGGIMLFPIGYLLCTSLLYNSDKAISGLHRFTESVFKVANSLFSKVFFLKLEPIKNSPRWDVIPLKMLIPFVAIGLAVLKLSSSKALGTVGVWRFLAAMAAFYSVTVWQMYQRKGDQFKMCHTAHTKILDNKVEGTSVAYQAQAAALALDLVHLDLWSHKKFSSFFMHQLYKAFNYLSFNNPDALKQAFSDIPQMNIKSDVGYDEFAQALNDKKVDVVNVTKLLNLYYHACLVGENLSGNGNDIKQVA